MKKKNKNQLERPKKTATQSRQAQNDQPRCGLCGKTAHLTKTPCCDNWICDDEHHYVMFSFARNSCSRNHDRYTLCGYHYHSGHAGNWQTCKKCKKELEPEMYVHYGTNEYNFAKLENPPQYAPTKCAKCGTVIILSQGGYSLNSEGYLCGKCCGFDWSLLNKFKR